MGWRHSTRINVGFCRSGIVNVEFSAEKLYEGFVKSILDCFPDESDDDSWLSEIESIVQEYE